MIPSYSILIDWINASPLRDTLNKYFNQPNFWGTLIIFKDSSSCYIEYRAYDSTICYKTTFSNVNSVGLSKTYDISGYEYFNPPTTLFENKHFYVSRFGHIKYIMITGYSKINVPADKDFILIPKKKELDTTYANIKPVRYFYRELNISNNQKGAVHVDNTGNLLLRPYTTNINIGSPINIEFMYY